MTEWHTIGDYQVSFDVRRDASRFIIRQCTCGATLLVGSGLIDADHVQFDQEVSIGIAVVGVKMHTLWHEMQARLRRGAS